MEPGDPCPLRALPCTCFCPALSGSAFLLAGGENNGYPLHPSAGVHFTLDLLPPTLVDNTHLPGGYHCSSHSAGEESEQQHFYVTKHGCTVGGKGKTENTHDSIHHVCQVRLPGSRKEGVPSRPRSLMLRDLSLKVEPGLPAPTAQCHLNEKPHEKHEDITLLPRGLCPPLQRRRDLRLRGQAARLPSQS